MSRIWAWMQSDTRRESAFTRVRHVIIDRDPYSMFVTTACGKRGTEPWHESDDNDLALALERDGIPLDLCPRCDRMTKGDKTND